MTTKRLPPLIDERGVLHLVPTTEQALIRYATKAANFDLRQKLLPDHIHAQDILAIQQRYRTGNDVDLSDLCQRIFTHLVKQGQKGQLPTIRHHNYQQALYRLEAYLTALDPQQYNIQGIERALPKTFGNGQ